MEIAIAIVIALAVAFIGKPAIKRFPVVFYIVVVLLDVLYLSHVLAQVSPVLDRVLYAYFNRCLLAFGFLTVVMFIGVFDASSKVRRWLNPVRGELSIIGALLCLPHIVNYLMVYLQRLLAGFVGIMGNVAVSFAVAVVVTVILAVLTVTSFNLVRKAMTPARWKQVQKWAYFFFVLMYVHILLVLGASALSGGRALTSLIVYTVVAVLYGALRGLKAVRDARAKAGRAVAAEDAAQAQE